MKLSINGTERLRRKSISLTLKLSQHRWLNDGFIAGEQVTPGAPWQIRITDELRARFVEQAPPDYLPMLTFLSQ